MNSQEVGGTSTAFQAGGNITYIGPSPAEVRDLVECYLKDCLLRLCAELKRDIELDLLIHSELESAYVRKQLEEIKSRIRLLAAPDAGRGRGEAPSGNE